ncbi:MAG: hypothetical protein ABSG11_21620 [Candidatus Korobacteraceae bacterium]|jgi:hypothetical protein
MSLEGQAPSGEYAGSKWGIFLRAPAIYFTLLERCGSKLVPLAKVAHATFGLKSGCDKFFFPHDVTDAAIKKNSDAVLFERYGFKWSVGSRTSFPEFPHYSILNAFIRSVSGCQLQKFLT